MNKGESCKVIAYFSVIPVGQESTSLGSYVAMAIAAMNKIEGLTCEVTPMGTLLEADSIEPILEAVKAAHESLADKGVVRVESTLMIDDRRDKPRTMEDKVVSVKKHIKDFET